MYERVNGRCATIFPSFLMATYPQGYSVLVLNALVPVTDESIHFCKRGTFDIGNNINIDVFS